MRWQHILPVLFLLILFVVLSCPAPAAETPLPVQVALETSQGRIAAAGGPDFETGVCRHNRAAGTGPAGQRKDPAAGPRPPGQRNRPV